MKRDLRPLVIDAVFIIIIVAAALVISVAIAGRAFPAERVPPHATWRASWYDHGTVGTCGPITTRGVAVNSQPGFPLPCGTKLRVCHHRRCAVVIVQDRMGAWPEPGCRCVDLRPWGFQHTCGDLSQGVCRVRVTKA